MEDIPLQYGICYTVDHIKIPHGELQSYSQVLLPFTERLSYLIYISTLPIQLIVQLPLIARGD